MTYDYYSSKVAGHHTNLYDSKTYPSNNSSDKAIKAYIAAGVPAHKIVMGIAFYGRNLQLNQTAKAGGSHNQTKYRRKNTNNAFLYRRQIGGRASKGIRPHE